LASGTTALPRPARHFANDNAFHKLLPCDVSVFGPLKTAYRDQVESLYCGGAKNVGKEHFIYRIAEHGMRHLLLAVIRSGFAKTSLIPFNPDSVLPEIQPPQPEIPLFTSTSGRLSNHL
jgi:hypothetical protein